MAKEFDIYLNKHLTECDLIVYSVPYRDGITAMNKIILESCLQNYILQKFIAVQTGSSLIAHIDEMIKTCYERLSIGTELEASADFSAYSMAFPEDLSLELDVEKIKMLATGFIEARNSLLLTVDPLQTSVRTSVGEGKSDIVVDAEIFNTLKRSIESANSALTPDTSLVGTNVKKGLRATSGTVLSAELLNLCYQITNTANTALEVTATVLGLEPHYPLGHAFTGVVTESAVTNTSCEKFEQVKAITRIMCESAFTLIQCFVPESKIIIAANATAILKRHRTIGEMDPDLLSKYDTMALDEVDYVIIS